MLLFEMCWFNMGIAVDPPPPSVKQANVQKEVAQTILASPYNRMQRGKKVPITILASLYTHPSLYGQCPRTKHH